MSKFFENVKTAEELKKAYHKLAIKLHPDNGGNEDMFKAMQAEFSKLWERLKNIHVAQDGTSYEATGDKATTETAAEFMDIISKLMFIDDLEVELCGSWIWVGGNSYPHRELLKALNFNWSKDKKRWYFCKDLKFSPYRKGSYSMKKIRSTWGSQVFKGTAEQEYLEGATA